MAKILTDSELVDIIKRTISDPDAFFGDSTVYEAFLGKLTELICDFFGGDPGNVSYDACDQLGWVVGVYLNECVPPDGGVFTDYDPDVVWEDGVETQK